MELLLVRHGPAGDREAWAASGRPDAERPLTEEGADKTRKAARGLARLAAPPDLLAASPLVRARQTAELLAERWPEARRAELAELAPAGDPLRALAWLDPTRRAARGEGDRPAASERVVWVGHEPWLGRFLAVALAGRRAPFLELKKGGAALVDFDGLPGPGKARLRWLLQPSALRRLG